MDTKICFKCGAEKPLSDFYKHPKMSDGHLGKCKECAKLDVRQKYEDNIQSMDYVEKERARGREKYARLGYKDTQVRAHKENSNTKRYLKSRGINVLGKEIHHWDYKLQNDVFIISPRAHKLIHKYIVFDIDSKRFTHNGLVIETKMDHYDLILSIFKSHNVAYEIDSYPIITD